MSFCFFLLAALCFKTYYSSHMVLQRGEPITLAGHAEPGRTIRVSLDGSAVEALTDAAGVWKVTFPAQAAGGPHVIIAADGRETVTLEDVLFGDVWFCTGQSNMWWPLSRSGNAEREIAAANEPEIRLLDVALTGSEEELDEPPYVRGWSRCTPLTARNFSAVGYHFARTVRERIGNVPIGLIGAGWGGPPISHFLPPRPVPPTALELSRDALRTAAWGFRTEDEMRAQCRAFFADERILHRFANLPCDPNLTKGIRLGGTNANFAAILKNFSGIARFSREVLLSKPWLGKNLKLNLGQGATPGVVFFNGERIGAIRDWEHPIPGAKPFPNWEFTIPASLVRGTTNRIDVILGFNDRLSYWGSVNGWLPLETADGKERMRLCGDDWLCERLVSIPVVPRTYGGSWGARIHPFFAFPVKGVLFYQGEADCKRPFADYLADQKRLVSCLRQGWNKPDLPFYCMQLANFASHDFCQIREAQRRAAEEIPYSGTACSIDIGDERNIHPDNKREQGRRMALQALEKTYGVKDVVADGPRFERVVREKGAAFVVYRPSSARLVLRGKELTGFEVLTADGAWKPVKAALNGDRVRLEAADPIRGVRYLWQPYPKPAASLFNDAGLPAVPFLHTFDTEI